MIKPIGANILVSPVEQTVSDSGIILPEADNTEPLQIGDVVSVGSSSDKDLVGKRIVFRRYDTSVIDEFVVLTLSDILALIDD